MTAEARLSIIETWPDRQKIQKAKGGKSDGREDKGGEGKRMRCFVKFSSLFLYLSNSFPLIRVKVEIFQGYITHILAYVTCGILNFNLLIYRAKLQRF